MLSRFPPPVGKGRGIPFSPGSRALFGRFSGGRPAPAYFSASSLFSSAMKVLMSLNWRYTEAKRT